MYPIKTSVETPIILSFYADKLVYLDANEDNIKMDL
jgi:hypothetical protein